MQQTITGKVTQIEKYGAGWLLRVQASGLAKEPGADQGVGEFELTALLPASAFEADALPQLGADAAITVSV